MIPKGVDKEKGGGGRVIVRAGAIWLPKSTDRSTDGQMTGKIIPRQTKKK